MQLQKNDVQWSCESGPILSFHDAHRPINGRAKGASMFNCELGVIAGLRGPNLWKNCATL